MVCSEYPGKIEVTSLITTLLTSVKFLTLIRRDAIGVEVGTIGVAVGLGVLVGPTVSVGGSGGPAVRPVKTSGVLYGNGVGDGIGVQVGIGVLVGYGVKVGDGIRIVLSRTSLR
jgi:hypothetical protein